MNRILLTSTALVAFAGAAAADGHTSISHAFSGKLGYTNNTNINEPDAAIAAAGNAGNSFGEDGFFWEGNLKTTATAALDNGITAGAYFEVTVAEDSTASGGDDDGIDLVASDFVLSLTSDTASLYFGDTAPAGKKYFSAAGDMESDGFSTDSDSNVLRGDVSFSGFNASVSTIVDDAADEATQLAVGLGGSFGAFTFGLGYQEASTFVDAEGDYNSSEVLGVSIGGTFAGATVTAAYAVDTNDGVGQSMNATQSAGVQLKYPFGPVTATAYYVMETQDAGGDLNPNYGVQVDYADNGIALTAKYRSEGGNTTTADPRAEWNVEGSYDLGNGLTVLAGALNENEGDDVDFYAGAKYNLGAGAEALVVFAADKDGDQADEIASGEYDPGLTVQVSFTF